MGNGCSCKGVMSLGPWGYETGKEWSYKEGRIKQIIIRYGGIIDSVMFKGDGDDYSPKFGGDGGGRTEKIDIDFPTEYLTGISGTYGSCGHGPNVCSLTFHTSINKYGPFGTQTGTAFSTNANGLVVTGFHGRYSRYLESIGVYITPHCWLSNDVPKVELIGSSTAAGVAAVPSFLSPPRSAAAIGGAGGREWDDGVFAAVKGVHVRVHTDTGLVSAVRFLYLKNDGSEEDILLSPFHGGHCGGTRRKTILFKEEDEYLIGVEGFYGNVEGISAIKSICFITNKAKYGPIGSEMGTYFTTMNSGDLNRKVVGFHRRSGAYLDAIGMHTQYF